MDEPTKGFQISDHYVLVIQWLGKAGSSDLSSGLSLPLFWSFRMAKGRIQITPLFLHALAHLSEWKYWKDGAVIGVPSKNRPRLFTNLKYSIGFFESFFFLVLFLKLVSVYWCIYHANFCTVFSMLSLIQLGTQWMCIYPEASRRTVPTSHFMMEQCWACKYKFADAKNSKCFGLSDYLPNRKFQSVQKLNNNMASSCLMHAFDTMPISFWTKHVSRRLWQTWGF